MSYFCCGLTRSSSEKSIRSEYEIITDIDSDPNPPIISLKGQSIGDTLNVYIRNIKTTLTLVRIYTSYFVYMDLNTEQTYYMTPEDVATGIFDI